MVVERYLKLSEFADRAQIGESTIYEWIKGGRLVEGVHYVRRGRCLRFPFPVCLTEPLAEPGRPGSRETPAKYRNQSRSIGPAANLDYGL